MGISPVSSWFVQLPGEASSRLGTLTATSSRTVCDASSSRVVLDVPPLLDEAAHCMRCLSAAAWCDLTSSTPASTQEA